ncbi:MAG: hypothetical protein ACYDEX_12070 [Mobilitalea sp.]
MKKVIAFILLSLCVAVLIFSSYKIKNGNSSLKFSFDENGNYTGFSNLTLNYTMEEAKDSEYFITQNSEVIANKKVWDNFVETSLKRINTDIRMVHFYTESIDSPYFVDLFFEDGYYYLFDSSGVKNEKQPYGYLLTLAGQGGSPVKDSSMIVLTNDNTLTFDKVMSAMISSSMSLKDSISPFRIIMFH